MIYLDASVPLAELLAEDRHPAAAFWRQDLCASWLTVYEVWNRLHAKRVAKAVVESAREMLLPVFLVELAPEVLTRALEPFPASVRTLDGLHLASLNFLTQQGRAIELASYDRRLCEAARAMGIEVLPI